MQPLEKPWKLLKQAEACIDKMEKSETLAELEENWISFLHLLERSFNKLINDLQRSPKFQGWAERGRIESLRRSDDLLSYLKNARDADEHTIADISKKTPGWTTISPTDGRTRVHLRNLKTGNGKIEFESDDPVLVSITPDHIELLAVTNRGKTYSVPKQHLGINIVHITPIHISRLAISFYKSHLEKAEKHFVK